MIWNAFRRKTLKSEILKLLPELEKSLLELNLHAYYIDAQIAGTQGKIDYLRDLLEKMDNDPLQQEGAIPPKLPSNGGDASPSLTFPPLNARD